jgi:hypothetical protein
MKRILKPSLFVFLSLVLSASIITAGESAVAVTGTSVAPADESVNNFGMSAGPGLTFRFLNKDWSGIEIPISGSFSYTSNTASSNQLSGMSVSAGIGYVMPLKRINGCHINVIPGITFAYSNNDSVADNSTAYTDEFQYSLSASLGLKFEIEYFINNLISFMPNGLTIGGSFTASASANYSEYSEYVLKRLNCSKDITFTHSWDLRANLGATAATLGGLMVRYYF